MLDIGSDIFRDKVFGCWLGKNCGGTLGAPLEEGFGRAEPFDIWWYPKLAEGGIPNDDLEMQLIWLKALEEVGPSVHAADLTQYWLDHIGYNWDEYGLSKTNLSLGLLPPVSGYYNNWFKDCMGSPIRSEIWACVAPGVPSIAVRYAYEDAICDHAGGEGLYGEMFNAAIESAAFVLSDREELLDIGMSYIPSASKTARAIRVARKAYKDGVDWKTARKRVLAATPHYNAQYAPINIGFQIIGWLYGTDFGDALCKAVNCGYDTDCTGATLGSILGILAGKSGLPHKWTAPLGESIATNESWGGLRHASDGSNPVPASLSELTDRVILQTRRVLTAHGALDMGSMIHSESVAMEADESTKRLWQANPLRIDYASAAFEVGIEYQQHPVAVPGQQSTLITHLYNRHPESMRLLCDLVLPAHWSSKVPQRQVEVPAHASIALEWDIAVPPPAQVERSNRVLLALAPAGRPALPAVPIVLVGANRYRHSALYPDEGRSAHELFEHLFEPELLSGSPLLASSRAGLWHDFYAPENALELGEIFSHAGVLYVQSFIWSQSGVAAWIGAPSTCPTKLWVNNQLVVQRDSSPLLRPNYDGNNESYTNIMLHKGWNEVLLKFVRTPEAVPFDCHLILTHAHQHHAGLWDVGRTRLPWDLP